MGGYTVIKLCILASRSRGQGEARARCPTKPQVIFLQTQYYNVIVVYYFTRLWTWNITVRSFHETRLIRPVLFRHLMRWPACQKYR